MANHLTLGFVFALALTGACATTTLAEGKPKVPANNPCQSDIKKYCSDVVPGNGRVAQCMKKHASELSYGCKKWGEQFAKKHPSVTKEADGK